MAEPLVTVVIPVYKIKEKYLRNCIDILLDQGRSDYRIILVDDGSPDNCGGICDEYAQKYEIVTAVHQKNQGAAVARNTGIAQVKTKWLTFVDADDWVEKDYIQTICNYISGDASDADMLMYDYVREYNSSKSEESINEETGFLPEEKLGLCKKSVFFHYIENGKRNLYTCVALWAKVYRVDFLKQNNIRFVPEARKGQDRLFNAEALTVATNIYYIHKTLYHYRCFEESRTNRYDANVPNLVTIELRNLQKLIEKYDLNDTVGDFFNCYVSTRIYSCMRLSYFHEKNNASYKKRVKGLKDLVGNEPYRSALKNVKTNLLNTEEKVFVYCIKLKLYWVCSLLVRARSGRTKKKLG